MKLLTFVLALLLAGPLGASEKAIVIATPQGLADVPAGKAVVQEAYRRLGLPVEFRVYPAAEALQKSNSGAVDAELQRIDGISRDFPGLVQVPIPINLIQAVAFSRKYHFPVSGWHSLRPYRLGIVKGILFAKNNTTGMNVKSFDRYDDLFQGLEDDRIDVAIMPRIEGLRAIRDSGRDDIREMAGILETIFLYHYVHVSRADLVERLSPVLREMLLSGETRRDREAALRALTR